MHRSPPQIRRSHSDGILEPTAEAVMEKENTSAELDVVHKLSNTSSSISRELTNSAQKEKRARHKQDELLTVDMNGGELNTGDSCRSQPCEGPAEGTGG